MKESRQSSKLITDEYFKSLLALFEMIDNGSKRIIWEII